MNKNEMKKFFIIQYVIIGLLVVLCLYLILDRSNSDTKINPDQSNSADVDYDTSSMKEVEASDILDMFKDKKTHVLYIGRSTCGVCREILPNLNEAQDDFDYVTQYLDITKVDRDSSDWEKIEKLLDKKTTLNIKKENGNSEPVTETYGYFVSNYGYTPTIIIISNNKMVAGHIGFFDLNSLKNWLQENGIG